MKGLLLASTVALLVSGCSVKDRIEQFIDGDRTGTIATVDQNLCNISVWLNDKTPEKGLYSVDCVEVLGLKPGQSTEGMSLGPPNRPDPDSTVPGEDDDIVPPPPPPPPPADGGDNGDTPKDPPQKPTKFVCSERLSLKPTIWSAWFEALKNRTVPGEMRCRKITSKQLEKFKNRLNKRREKLNRTRARWKKKLSKE